MQSIQYVLLAVLLLSSTFKNKAVDDKQMKVLFIKGFTSYLEWNPKDVKDALIIGVLGDSYLNADLIAGLDGKKCGQYKVKVKKFANVQSIDECHFLYIPEAKSNKFSEHIDKFAKRPIIIISENAELYKKGANINFRKKNGKLAFDLCKACIESKGIKVSPALVKLAASVK